MGVFKKQGVYWIAYYLHGDRKREGIDPDKRSEAGMIRLRPEGTKTQEGRLISLTKELTEVLKTSRIYLASIGEWVPYDFMYHGNPIRPIRRAFEAAYHRAGINGVVFRDLRHTLAIKCGGRARITSVSWPSQGSGRWACLSETIPLAMTI